MISAFVVKELTVDPGEMQKKTSLKTKFSQFNGKRFYVSDGITSLPISHPVLKELQNSRIAEYTKKMNQRIETYFWDEKEVLLNIKNKAQKQHERLLLYYQILKSTPNYFLLDKKQDFVAKKQLIFKDTKYFILEGIWQ